MASLPTTDLDTYRRTDEILDVFRTAVREAQSDSHHQGVANVYYFDGKRYFELPSGDITQTPQFTLVSNGAEQLHEPEP